MEFRHVSQRAWGNLGRCALVWAALAGWGMAGRVERGADQTLVAFAEAVQASEFLAVRDREILAQLIPAYPDAILAVEAEAGGIAKLLLRGGAVVVLDDRKEKSSSERLISADVEDMFSESYPAALPEGKWPFAFDPGRYRSTAFFKGVYGASAKDVSKHLVPVDFCGRKIQFTSLNGGAEALKRIAAELDVLRKANPKLNPYLTKLGGGFNWREVAGTESLSAHAFGIAIDLNPALGGYWKWDKGDASDMKRRRDYPAEIVTVFEKHGFVWGGKWYHFDLMHFEYRPELVGERRAKHQPKADGANAETADKT